MLGTVDNTGKTYLMYAPSVPAGQEKYPAADAGAAQVLSSMVPLRRDGCPHLVTLIYEWVLFDGEVEDHPFMETSL